jgi:hypothetical protein
MKSLFALMFVVASAACTGTAHDPSDTEMVSQHVSQSDPQRADVPAPAVLTGEDADVPYCAWAGTCLVYGNPCCTGYTHHDTRCKQTQERCCRDSGASCTVNASQCCWGSCGARHPGICP